MPTLIPSPSRVQAAGAPPKLIDEYVGRVNSRQDGLSVAHMRSPQGWVEPGQTPDFDEYTLVLRGLLRVEHEQGVLDVAAGQAVVVRRGEWVRYSTPEPEGAEYVAVCLPAFSLAPPTATSIELNETSPVPHPTRWTAIMAESEPGRPMDGKVCLVTGATAGIGLVAASELARCGARVIGVGRSQERCGEAARLIRDQTAWASVEYLVADLSSQSEIRRLAQGVKASTGRLDVLLNNAGGIYLQRQETADGIERTFALNHLAYFLLTNLLLDLIKASAPARIINVSSGRTRVSRSTLTICRVSPGTVAGGLTSSQSSRISCSRESSPAGLREPASPSMPFIPAL